MNMVTINLYVVTLPNLPRTARHTAELALVGGGFPNKTETLEDSLIG
jgi:hypothetical protein